MSGKRWYLPAPPPGVMLDPLHGIFQVSAQKVQIWTTAKLLLTQRNIVFPPILTFLKPHELFLKVFYSKCVQKLEYSYVNKIQVNIHLPKNSDAYICFIFIVSQAGCNSGEGGSALCCGTPAPSPGIQSLRQQGAPGRFSSVSTAYNLISQLDWIVPKDH